MRHVPHPTAMTPTTTRPTTILVAPRRRTFSPGSNNTSARIASLRSGVLALRLAVAGVVVDLIRFDHRVADLLRQAREVARRVRDQDRGRLRRGADLLEHVEVLRHEHEVHDVLRGR